jgi:hypothetical protein
MVAIMMILVLQFVSKDIKSKRSRETHVQVWRNQKQLYLAGRNIKWYNHFGKQIGSSPKKLNTELPYDPVIPFVGICPREMKPCAHTRTYTQKFIASLFIMAKREKQPSVHQLMNGSTKRIPYNEMLFIHEKE